MEHHSRRRDERTQGSKGTLNLLLGTSQRGGEGVDRQAVVAVSQQRGADFRQERLFIVSRECRRSRSTQQCGDGDASQTALGSDALTLEDLRSILLEVPATAEQLTPHPEEPGVYFVEDASGVPVAVTFDREVLDRSSPKVRLLSYGDPLFDLVLARAGVDVDAVLASEPESSNEPVLTIAEQIGELPLGHTL